MKPIALSLLILSTVPRPAPAYPIPPQPLRWLYQGADLVVLATPQETIRLKEPELTAKVALTLQKVLKGTCEAKEITVLYSPSMICPSPDRYPKGETVLAFLVRDRNTGLYRAPGLSYATKKLPPDALKIYLDRISDLGAMRAEPGKGASDDDILEWLTKCMEHPATRWEGACEFIDPAVGIVRGAATMPRFPAGLLTATQGERLAKALAATEEPGYPEALMAAAALHPFRDERINATLIRGIRHNLDPKRLHVAFCLARALDGRLDLPEGAKLLEQANDAADDGVRLAMMQKYLELISAK